MLPDLHPRADFTTMLVIKTGSPLCFGVGSERARHGAAPFSSSWRRRPCALGAAAAPGGKEVSLGRSAVAADDLLCRRSAVALTAAAASWMLLPARTKAEEAAATIGKAYDRWARP